MVKLHLPATIRGTPLPGFVSVIVMVFLFNAPATTGIYPLSLHDALPISCLDSTTSVWLLNALPPTQAAQATRSEEHTSELQSLRQLVCRPLLEKKNICRRSFLTQPAGLAVVALSLSGCVVPVGPLAANAS